MFDLQVESIWPGESILIYVSEQLASFFLYVVIIAVND